MIYLTSDIMLFLLKLMFYMLFYKNIIDKQLFGSINFGL